MSGYLGGWRYDIEHEPANWSRLIAMLATEEPVLAMRGEYQEVSIDPRKFMKLENQGQVGSCQGHSISSCVEWCYAIATGGEKIQLSRAYGYYETQRIDGLSGDKGSTIQGGIKLATEFGICEESLWPYANRYDNRRPKPIEELRANAAQYKIGKSYRLTSYDAIRTFLGSGQGAVSLGITWNSSVDSGVVNNYSGASGGGHAIGLYSLSERKDEQGRPWLWMMNSWGDKWGQNGWAEWSPNAVEQMTKGRWSVFVGVSDMPAVKPRSLDVSEWQRGLRV